MTTSGGSALTTGRPWPATWLRIRCSLEERHDDELREEPLLETVDQAVGAAPRGRLAELDRPHQAEPAHVADDVVPLDEGGGQLEQALPRARPSARPGPARRARGASRARRHRELVRRERRAVAERVLHRVEDAFVHGARHQQRSDRHVPARERLRDGNEVGLEAPVLEREQLPGAAEARLHLVDAEERPVAPAERLRALEVAGGGRFTPLPWTGSTRNTATSSRRSSSSSASRSPNGTRSKPGSSGPKRSVNSGFPFAESEPSVRP